MSCECYSCKPQNIPDDYDDETCSICFVPLGDQYPKIPRVGSMCLDCCSKYDSHCSCSPKLDPYTRLPLKTCPKGHVVHRFNFIYHMSC